MNTKQHPKNVRSATVPQAQGNAEAKLLNADGTPKVTKQAEAEQAQAESNRETGLEIFKLFSFAVPDKGDAEATGNADSVTGMSFSKYAVMEARQAAQNDLAQFISYCEDAAKACKDAAKALITPHYELFADWATSLVKGSGSVKLDNGAKGSKVELSEDEFSRSIKALVYSLGKVSNTTFFGEKSSDGKAPKPAIFDNPGKVAKLGGFEGTNGRIKAKAVINHVMTDEGDNIEYCLRQIANLANHVNHHEAEAAGSLWSRLTGKILTDQRIVLTPNHLRDWTQARMLGIMGSAFETAKREALQAKKLKAMTEVELVRLEDYRRNIRIALNRAEDIAELPKVETLPGSNVEAPNGKATLPTPTLAPKTLEDIERNKVLKQAGRMADAEMNQAITKGELDSNDVEACQTFWEASNIRILTELGEIEAPAEETDETTDAETVETETASN